MQKWGNIMKTQYAASRSGLFLIELILSIFFFIIAAAIVMQLFVKSHFVSEDAINTNYALLYTQNISELFLSANGDFSVLEQEFHPETIPISDYDASAALYFDKDWQRLAAAEDAAYMVSFHYNKETAENPFAYLNIYINECPNSYEPLKEYDYTLDCIHHQEIKKYTGGGLNG